MYAATMLRLSRSLVLFSICFGSSALAMISCADSEGTASSTTSTNEDAGADAPASFSLRIDPVATVLVVGLDAATVNAPVRAYALREGEPEKDLTNDVEWSIDNTNIAGVNLGTIATRGIGGKTKIRASYEGVSAEADLTVMLKGTTYLPGTDATTEMAFDMAMVDPDPTNAPAIEYPEDGVVLPANLPPIEAQWSQGNANIAYRVRVSSPDVLDVTLYTTNRELLFPAGTWKKLGGSSPDGPLTLTVEAIDAAGNLRTSAPRTMTVSSDGIDESAIYVWQSSTGSFRVLDIINGTDIPLPTNSPQLTPGQPCSGCHRISRDGKRFSYTYNGGEFNFGTLAYDDTQKQYAAKIAPSPALRGTYASFNPLEDSTRAAMLFTAPDTVPQNTAGTVRLLLTDPDTNAAIPNNFADMIQQIPPENGRATLMPDWSPAGDFIVFTAYDSNANYVRLLGDDTVLGSVVEMPVQYMADGSFQFGAPKVLVAAPSAAGTNPDTGENNVLPSVSPDGSIVAFTRANGWWSIKTQQSLINLSGRIALVRRADGQVLELERGASNGPDDVWSSTWPQWAPTLGKKWVWLAYASERPYGHRLTPQNSTCSLVQGQKQCKQLWITALDRTKLAQGMEDPSQAAFWIPGQSITAQYVSPQWTVAVINVPK
jgi:WD40-like Beta Propeller Repeat